MRRPRSQASHEPPHIEDLLDEASQHLRVLGDLTVMELAHATSDQFNALHGLWATFSKLPQRGTASCVGITKAIMLLTNGRMGPAFDSIVRKKLGLKDHLKSSEEWIDVLRGISDDILAFEKRHGNLVDIVPAQLAKYTWEGSTTWFWVQELRQLSVIPLQSLDITRNRLLPVMTMTPVPSRPLNRWLT